MTYDFDEDLEDDRFEDDGYPTDEDDESRDDDEDRDDEEDPPDDGDDDGDLDEDFPLGEGTADTSADVWCPYCGESSEIALDPGSGSVQRYVEDCPVCCRPWLVNVRYDEEGIATVTADPDDSMDDE